MREGEKYGGEEEKREGGRERSPSSVTLLMAKEECEPKSLLPSRLFCSLGAIFMLINNVASKNLSALYRT